MSDEYTGPGRDGNASTDGSRPVQHPVPSHAGASGAAEPPGPYPDAPNGGPASGSAYPGGAYPGGAYPGGAYPGGPYPAGPYPGGPYPGGPAFGPPVDSGPPTLLAPRPPRRSRTMTGIVTAALVAGLVGGGAGFGGAYALLDGGTAAPSLSSSPASPGAAAAAPGSVAAAAQKAMPSTVDIRVQLGQGVAEGSGVVLTADGNVLTNNHVVAGARTISVTLADGSEHPATVVGTSPSYDLAVIKLQDTSGLTPAVLGQSAQLQVGQPVVAIGSPQGLTGTVTTGIISAFDRTVQVQGEDGSGVVYNGLQTDTPINPGNSGGPLVNLDGQVVGINSAIATSGQNSGSIGLGFAIPVDQAKRVAQEIMNGGTATKPLLGVQGGAGSAADDDSGARIAAVQQGSPAAQAGLVAGDVVSKVGDARVEDFSDLIARIGSYAPGQQVTLTVGSGGAQRAVTVTLGSQPDQAASTSTGGESNSPFGGLPNPFDRGGN
jgi:putative serine protease PepD